MVGVLTFDSPEKYREFVECNQNIEIISLKVFPKQFNSVLVLTYKSPGVKLINEIVKDNIRLREALEFYADNSNYLIEWSDKFDEYMPSVADNDGGEIARQALGDSE